MGKAGNTIRSFANSTVLGSVLQEQLFGQRIGFKRRTNELRFKTGKRTNFVVHFKTSTFTSRRSALVGNLMKTDSCLSSALFHSTVGEVRSVDDEMWL